MLSIARVLRQRALQSLHSRRSFAQVVDATPSTSTTAALVPASSSTKAVDWRKGRVPVREDHGLYAFFRRKQSDEELEGDARFEVVETPDTFGLNSGRGWKAEELRLKCFKDLHVLWYVLLRERNLLATQKEESRRMGVGMREHWVNGTKLYHVRKSMARIKTIINERRLAYEQALELVQTERDTHHNQKVLEHLQEQYKLRTRLTRRARREAKLAAAVKAAEAEKKAKEQAKNREKATPKAMASQTAAAGLFGSS